MPTLSWYYQITPPTAVAGVDAAPTLDDRSYRDLALDPATGDLALPVQLITGADCVAQRLRIRLRFWLGEWFLDQRLGIPYVRSVLVKNPDLVLIRSIFRRVILSTPGVARLDSLVLTHDRAGRRLVIEDFRATFVDGSAFQLTEVPFVVVG